MDYTELLEKALEDERQERIRQDMEAKHTPGPWRRYGGMVDGYGIASEHGEVISQDPFNGLNNVANARLIAAAPELLAALEKIDSNAAESAEWIRSIIRPALAKTKER